MRVSMTNLWAGELSDTLNELWLKDRPERTAIERTIADSTDGSTSLNPTYFDLRLGNICNLKCTACKPLYSSQIERDAVHAPWITDAPYTRLANRFGDRGEWFDAEGLVDEMVGMSGNLAMVQLAGGEPTINKTQIAFLTKLCTEGRAAAIDLTVVTNLIAVGARFTIFWRNSNPCSSSRAPTAAAILTNMCVTPASGGHSSTTSRACGSCDRTCAFGSMRCCRP